MMKESPSSSSAAAAARQCRSSSSPAMRKPAAATTPKPGLSRLQDMGLEGNLPLDSTIVPCSDQKSSHKAHLKSQGKVMKESSSPPKTRRTSTTATTMSSRKDAKPNHGRARRKGYYVADLQARRKVAMAIACAKKESRSHADSSSLRKAFPLMNLEEYLKERAASCGGPILEEMEEESRFGHARNAAAAAAMAKARPKRRVSKGSIGSGNLFHHVSPRRDGQFLQAKISGHSYKVTHHHHNHHRNHHRSSNGGEAGDEENHVNENGIGNGEEDEEEDANDEEEEEEEDDDDDEEEEEDDDEDEEEEDDDEDGMSRLCDSDRSGCGMFLPWPSSQCTLSSGNAAKNERLMHYAGGCFYGSKMKPRQWPRAMSLLYSSDGETAPLMTEEDSVSDSDGQMVVPTRYAEAGSNFPFQKRREMGGICGKNRSLSRKYRPKAFKDLIGQNMVVESLSNAILRSKIAPLYLFHGPRGTGKTSAAKIFACAMNCLSIEELRPCGLCNACTSFNAGTYYDVKEVDAAGNCGIESMRILLKHLCLPPTLSRYKVFIMDDCHMLTPEAWSALLKSLEDPPDHVVFILITSCIEQLPRAAISRCQKFMFARVKDGDIVLRLHELARQEKIDIDSDALQFIASQSDGSFRDAETMLDQLSLRGKRVTLSVVREMMGLIPDEALFSLLDSALASDTVSTVDSIRELMGAGFEPLALVSQLATLITDILAGRCRTSFMKVRRDHHRQERLQRALRVLSDVEKQLRSCGDRTTWLTAAFLQLANPDMLSLPSSRGTSITRSPTAFREQNDDKEAAAPNSGRRHSWGGKERDSRLFPFQLEYAPAEPLSKNLDTCGPSMAKKIYPCDLSPHSAAPETVHGAATGNKATIMSPCTMDNIWRKVLQSCHSHSLKQLLQSEARLVSLSVTEAFAIARLECRSPEQKAKAEKARESISNAFQLALFCPVKVEIQLCRNGFAQKVPNSAPEYQIGTKQVQENAERSSFRKSCSSIGKRSPLCHGLEQKKHTSGQGVSEKTKVSGEKATDRSANDFSRMYKRPGDVNLIEKPINSEYDMESHTKTEEQSHCLDDPKSISLHWNDSRDDLDGYTSDSESGERYVPGGLLCWKGARATSLKDDKAHHTVVRRRRTRFLVRFVPCGKEDQED